MSGRLQSADVTNRWVLQLPPCDLHKVLDAINQRIASAIGLPLDVLRGRSATEKS